MIIDIATHVFPKLLMDRVKRITPTFGSRGSRIENTPQLYDFGDRSKWGAIVKEAGLKAD